MRKAAVKDILERTDRFSKEEVDRLVQEMERSMAGKQNGKNESPSGGICLRAAERKYGISARTISRWVARGLIAPILRTKNELYLDEIVLCELIAKYKKAPGRGKRTIVGDND